MPPKSTRITRRKGSSSVNDSSPSGETSVGIKHSVNQTTSDVNSDSLSASELLKVIIERNKDPDIQQLLIDLSSKIPTDFKDLIEADKRARSIVISGLEEPTESMRLLDRGLDLERKVCDILEIVKVDARPSEVFRMGKPNSAKPRLVKVVLPSTSCWRTALSNSRLLRSSASSNVFIRKSMTPEERKREFELRQIARERNKGKKDREWVVYKGQLTHVSDLPKRHPGNA
ncbi:hypothetical protein Y032_0022g484 [Ancylostoma ceylanicum]|uniref:Uncharacterized protein n=1 Tax=Ancylostoma ceylanicum TaxID=53326 RepID=A0A016UYS6_9BILA|nr:hypothetical protein Y032_0022g484 [Ancylostoma ceylanicum]